MVAQRSDARPSRRRPPGPRRNAPTFWDTSTGLDDAAWPAVEILLATSAPPVQVVLLNAAGGPLRLGQAPKGQMAALLQTVQALLGGVSTPALQNAALETLGYFAATPVVAGALALLLSTPQPAGAGATRPVGRVSARLAAAVEEPEEPSIAAQERLQCLAEDGQPDAESRGASA